MKRLILAIVGIFISLQVFAVGSVNNAKVIQVRVDQDGRGIVTFDLPVTGTPPSCVNAAYINALSFNSSTAGGKGILATLLLAKATGTNISAIGTGTCTFYSTNVEDFSYGAIN